MHQCGQRARTGKGKLDQNKENAEKALGRPWGLSFIVRWGRGHYVASAHAYAIVRRLR